jgi:hypothetical protein
LRPFTAGVWVALRMGCGRLCVCMRMYLQTKTSPTLYRYTLFLLASFWLLWLIGTGYLIRKEINDRRIRKSAFKVIL